MHLCMIIFLLGSAILGLALFYILQARKKKLDD